jgi:hypothetical protein
MIKGVTTPEIAGRTAADTVTALRTITGRKDIAASRRLRSGDVAVTFTSSTQWWHDNTDKWLQQGFGEGATVATRTYPVLAKGLSANSLRGRSADEILGDIHQRNQCKVARVHTRLPRREGAERAMLLLEMPSPEAADHLVREGLLYEGGYFTCEPFDGSINPTRCFRCLQFGHKARNCNAAEAVCRYCAKLQSCHPANDFDKCLSKADEHRRRCAACSGPHDTFARVCLVRRKEAERAREAYRARPLRFDLTRYQEARPPVATATPRPPSPPARREQSSSRPATNPRGRPPKRPRIVSTAEAERSLSRQSTLRDQWTPRPTSDHIANPSTQPTPTTHAATAESTIQPPPNTQ